MNETDNRTYYDAFAERYDRGRTAGYHALLDDQAALLVERVATGREVLEVGCGTGLVLQRVAAFAARAEGVDLSPRMLDRARSRGLVVKEARAESLPFPDGSFDVAYSFKVLAHVDDLRACLSEMFRVVRPGGFVVFDFYNRHSLRYLVKRLGSARATSSAFDEGAIATHYRLQREVIDLLPREAELTQVAGLRIVTAHAGVFAVPGLGRLTRAVELGLMDGALARWAGFVVLTTRKRA